MTDRTTIAFDPDDDGQSRVQDNGMLSVGRAHAGETVAWWIEAGEADTHPTPTDQGQGRVQGNGTLYVGREYAGETVQWWIETRE